MTLEAILACHNVEFIYTNDNCTVLVSTEKGEIDMINVFYLPFQGDIYVTFGPSYHELAFC